MPEFACWGNETQAESFWRVSEVTQVRRGSRLELGNDGPKGSEVHAKWQGFEGSFVSKSPKPLLWASAGTSGLKAQDAVLRFLTDTKEKRQ